MAKIEIINRALLKLGEPPISSISDAAFGHSYEIIYDDMKKLLLSSYPWRFAVKKINISRDAKKILGKSVYHLPADFLLLIKVCAKKSTDSRIVSEDELSGYEIVGKSVVCLTDDGIVVEYVSAIDDEDIFPPIFREALAAKIAAELAMRLKQSVSLKQALDAEFYNFIRQAELNNEIEKDVEILPDNSWVNVREKWS